MLLYSQKASKCNKAIPQYPRKLGKPLLECLNLQGYSEFVHLMKIQSTSISQEKRHIFNKTHLVLPACVHFQQKSSFPQLRLHSLVHLKFPGKNKTQNTFCTEQLPVAAFNVRVVLDFMFFSLFFSCVFLSVFLFFLESESLC